MDVIQGGAGTSTNMNANEVIANRALELPTGRAATTRDLHPNNHVNLSQSHQRRLPDGGQAGAAPRARRAAASSCGDLADAFRAKGVEFAPHVKMGRTQLQDAVPMTLGQEFTAFGHTLARGRRPPRARRRRSSARSTSARPRSAPASPPAPATPRRCARHLSEITGLELITAPDLVEATSDTGAFVQLSGVLKRTRRQALQDLQRPAAALARARAPASARSTCRRCSPGSSIMPGKVNPVIPEVVNQVCFDVIGADVTVTMAAEAGQLQLNAFEPIIAYRLCARIALAAQRLHDAARALRDGHHRQPRPHAALRGALGRHRHRPRAGTRLRARHRDRQDRATRATAGCSRSCSSAGCSRASSSMTS